MKLLLSTIAAISLAGAAQAKPIDQWDRETFTVAVATCAGGEAVAGGGALLAGATIAPPVAAFVWLMCVIAAGDLYSEGDWARPAPHSE